jgi:hypothetical protein
MDEQSSRSVERWERLEKRVEDASRAAQEYEQATDSRIASLEELASSQYTAAVVADNWGSHFDSRVSELEQGMADLELIRLSEIRDERDDRMEDLHQHLLPRTIPSRPDDSVHELGLPSPDGWADGAREPMSGDVPALLRQLLPKTMAQVGSLGGILVQHQSTLLHQQIAI